MSVDPSTIPRQGKRSPRSLLRASSRAPGQVTPRPLAQLRPCALEERAAIRWALRHQPGLPPLAAAQDPLGRRHGGSVGALWLVSAVAPPGGMVRALGTTRAGQWALGQVRARVIEQGARLSAVRVAGMPAVGEVRGLEQCNAGALDEPLDGLGEQQTKREERRAQQRRQGRSPGVCLSDVTRSDGEGEPNALAAFGDHREGKQGTRQSGRGLLCDAAGTPWSIAVLPGQTHDPQTGAAHMRPGTERCGGGRGVRVGDRGMRKRPHIAALGTQGWPDIPAIPKPHMARGLTNAVLHSGVCAEAVTAVTPSEGMRDMVRRNPLRAQARQNAREEKSQTRQQAVEQHNRSLTAPPRAKGAGARRHRTTQCTQVQRAPWGAGAAAGRLLARSLERDARQQAAQLEGGSVMQTARRQEQRRQEMLHARYKAVALVEWALRSCKTPPLRGALSTCTWSSGPAPMPGWGCWPLTSSQR